MTPHPTPGNDGLMLAQCPFCGSPGQPIGIHGNLAHCPNKQCVLYSRKMYHIEWNTRAPTQPPAPVVTGWIACGERMPVYGSNVMAWGPVCGHHVARSMGHHLAAWDDERDEWVPMVPPSHWMELPPPPGQEQGVVVSEEQREAMVEAAIDILKNGRINIDLGSFSIRTLANDIITAALGAGGRK